jgi:hypothetical protein
MAAFKSEFGRAAAASQVRYAAVVYSGVLASAQIIIVPT